VQKARLARIQQTKNASRNAFLANKHKFDARLQRLQAEHDDDGNNPIDDDEQNNSYNNAEDMFQMQHHHLLACLERTTVLLRQKYAVVFLAAHV